VVWLNVPLDALAKRVTAVGTESRPLLPPDAAQHQAFARLAKLLEQRGAAYGHADATVSIQGSSNCNSVAELISHRELSLNLGCN
jgi:shikimate kinase